MSDREFENYLALLGGMLRLRRTQRDSIAGELRDHLIEHVAHLETSGITHEEAVRRALEEFGDAAALAAGFSALVGMRRRRLIMRCTIGTTIVMTGLVLAMLAFRPPVIDDHSIAQAQGESKSAGKARDERREVTAASRSSAKSDRDLAAREKLKNDIDLEFKETPLKDALEYISEKTGVQYYIVGRSLTDASISIDQPVTFNLRSVPADMALDIIFHDLSLGYRIRNGVIMVASEQEVQSQTEVRVYRVPDGMADELAALIPATIATDHWREQVQMQVQGSRGPMGAMPGGFGGPPGMAAAPGGMGGLGGGELTGGGGPGMIRVFRGTLVVSQTPEVHQKIEKLIDDLASAGAMEPQPHRGRVGDGEVGGTTTPPGYPHSGFGSGTGMRRTGYGAVRGDKAGYAPGDLRRRESQPAAGEGTSSPDSGTPSSDTVTPLGPPGAVPGPTTPGGTPPRAGNPGGPSATPPAGAAPGDSTTDPSSETSSNSVSDPTAPPRSDNDSGR